MNAKVDCGHATGLCLQDFWRTVGPSASLSAAATAGSGWKLKRTELSRDERASGEATERQVELAYVGSQFTNGQGSYGLSYGELVIEE